MSYRRCVADLQGMYSRDLRGHIALGIYIWDV